MEKKEMLSKKIIFFIAGIIIFLVLISSLCSQEEWPSYNFCCEKTKSGAWCQNAPENSCDISIDPLTKERYRKTPTSCEATSFCKPGCCIDTQEGLCMENTPQRVCQEAGGTWLDDEKCNVAQCSLGCCILGDQASFVTLTRCKRLSSLFGLETNFNSKIEDEVSCIFLAQSQDKGACVFEIEGERTCKFTTRAECLSGNLGKNLTSKPEFYKDYLCSADELGTNCGPTTQTMCIEGKDEVYFKDSCGNPANIYDASRIKDPSYWKKVVPKSQSCNPNSPNINSRNCGNCDYSKGSICKKGNAAYGDYICKDINCYNTKNGNNYKNGESWCVYQGLVGNGRDSVGSRHFRHICINGEEIIEPCADYRNEICIQNKIQTSQGTFTEAACRINRWQDCLDQKTKEDCLNTDKRDCYWKEGLYLETKELEEETETKTTKIFSGQGTGGFSGGITGNVILESKKPGSGEKQGICLPLVPPGLKFWNSNDAKSICNIGSSNCEVKYTHKALVDIFVDVEKKCEKNCQCLKEDWVIKLNSVCVSLGDCGAYINFVGKFTNKGIEWKIDGERKKISETLNTALLNEIKKGK